MTEPMNVEEFGKTAGALARNPLGIIALFITLVYGLAVLVTIVGSSLTPAERVPLVWFLILFPVLVLSSFVWLVAKHSAKLYAPADFREEANFVYMHQVRAAASLGAAQADLKAGADVDIDAITAAVSTSTVAATLNASGPAKRILWVDDRTVNSNRYARSAFQALGIKCTLAASTEEALQMLATERFAAIISDMHRPESQTAGHDLLQEVRKKGIETPFFLHTSANSKKDIERTARYGGQGHTPNVDELFAMVTRAVATQGILASGS